MLAPTSAHRTLLAPSLRGLLSGSEAGGEKTIEHLPPFIKEADSGRLAFNPVGML